MAPTRQREVRAPAQQPARDRYDRPLLPAAVLLVLGAVFVALRLHFAAHGDVSTFVQAGTRFTDPARAPRDLHVAPGAGYDGQFYYRFALEPWNLSHVARGITLDTPFRRQRIGYPVLAWLVALGRPSGVPGALVAVNLAALAAAGFFAGLWVQSLGRHALWGLLPAGYSGLVWSLSRDLTELTAVAFLLAGLVAVRRQRHLVAGLAFAAAVLCREAVLVVVVAALAVRGWELARRRARTGAPDLVWLVPAVAFGAWQIVCRVAYGTVPLLDDRGNAHTPFVAVAQAVVRWLEHPRRDTVLQLAQLAVLAAVCIAAAVGLRTTSASGFERVAFALAAVLVVSLSRNVWTDDPMELRAMADVFVLGSGVALGARGVRRSPVALLTAANWAVWLVAAGLRIKSP